MNKKGFTLMELLTVLVVMVIIAMVVYPSVTKILQKNSNEMYSSYEKMMVEYAKASNSSERISALSELEGLDKIKEEKCVGYVDTLEEKAYIKCSNKYTTKGYKDLSEEE